MLLQVTVLADEATELVSFGLVRACASAPQPDWEAARGTIYDPATFGPRASWACACGKLRGTELRNSICDRCGVKVGDARRLRRERFGHIRLRAPVPHPFEPSCMIGVVPVLPIAYRKPTRYGHDLNFLYNELVAENLAEGAEASADRLARRVQELYCNEWLASPRQQAQRNLRSLLYYAIADEGASPRRVGVYLQAMGVRIGASAAGGD